jgi:glycosyltransferase involved in cell wall biosynthesis
VESFYSKPAEDYFLIVSELVAYKQVDYAVRAFTSSGRRLRIAGDGPEYRRLARLAGPSVEFCGRVSDSELRELYARCRAFVLPGEEDFGITPVEALASGKPVVALGRGGALETTPPFGGILYSKGDEVSLLDAIARLERLEPSVRAPELRGWAERFSERKFMERMGEALFGAVEQRSAEGLKQSLR